MARHVIRALDLAAAALDAGKLVPAEAADAMARPYVPAWMYNWMGILGWFAEGRQNKTLTKLWAQPYLE